MQNKRTIQQIYIMALFCLPITGDRFWFIIYGCQTLPLQCTDIHS